MNFSDIFRSFLGLNRSDYSNGNSGLHNDFRNPIWNIDDDDDDGEDELYHGSRQGRNIFPGDSFNVFSDPLEMARYAEHQMERMMSLFSSMMDQQFGGNFPQPPNMPSLPPGSPLPAIEGKKEGNIRDEYLKPGYQKRLDQNKVDSDLDSKVNDNNLDSLLDNISKLQVDDKSNNNHVNRFMPENPANHNNVYFRQVITRSITRPDGSIETTRTVRNGDGTEQTTSIISHNNDQDNNFNRDNIVRPFNGSFWNNLFGF